MDKLTAAKTIYDLIEAANAGGSFKKLSQLKVVVTAFEELCQHAGVELVDGEVKNNIAKN